MNNSTLSTVSTLSTSTPRLSHLQCFGDRPSFVGLIVGLLVVFMIVGIFLEGSLVYVCFKMTDRLSGPRKSIKQGRMINNLTLTMFLILLASWCITCPLLIITSAITTVWPSRFIFCAAADFMKIFVFYMLNFTYLGNTSMRFLYTVKPFFAIKLEEKRPTRYWIGTSVILAVLLGFRRIIFTSSASSICLGTAVKSSNPEPLFLRLGGLICFAIIPLLLNAILNAIVLIQSRKRDNKFARKDSMSGKQRKLKTWTSANVHFVSVALYAVVFIVSLSKKFSSTLKRILRSCEYGFMFNALCDIQLIVIMGIIVPIVNLIYRAPMKKRVLNLWLFRKNIGALTELSMSEKSHTPSAPGSPRTAVNQSQQLEKRTVTPDTDENDLQENLDEFTIENNADVVNRASEEPGGE